MIQWINSCFGTAGSLASPIVVFPIVVGLFTGLFYVLYRNLSKVEWKWEKGLYIYEEKIDPAALQLIAFVLSAVLLASFLAFLLFSSAPLEHLILYVIGGIVGHVVGYVAWNTGRFERDTKNKSN